MPKPEGTILQFSRRPALEGEESFRWVSRRPWPHNQGLLLE